MRRTSVKEVLGPPLHGVTPDGAIVNIRASHVIKAVQQMNRHLNSDDVLTLYRCEFMKAVVLDKWYEVGSHQNRTSANQESPVNGTAD